MVRRIIAEIMCVLYCFASVTIMSFEGKVILITGAGSGIGAQTAKALAKLGGRLAIVDCNFDRINRVAEEIIDNGCHTPLVQVADVTEDAEQIIAETIEHFGKLDILINNVGIIVHQGLTNIDMNAYDRVMNTNLRSAVVLTHLAVPYLKLTKGNIVNVSSIVGSMASPNFLAYSMSKAALNHFTKCIAIELGPMGIRVNAVNPGITNTPIVESIPADEREQVLDNFRNSYPLQRIGEPRDISKTIAFLASEEASLTWFFLCNNLFLK